MRYQGSCHCGAVKFEVEAAAKVRCEDCNCSICAMSGFLHLIVPRAHFRLLQGEASLATYTFNTGVAKHHFCRVCGIKPYYIPRSNPDGVDVNVRCLSPQPEAIEIVPFNGRNWEAQGHELAHLTQR
jgi:hypothetical protein